MGIQVTAIDDQTFEVEVRGRTTTTTHRVTASPAYVAALTKGKITAADLIARSFEFLLEREPKTSILRNFDLPLIQTYFPEYEKTMKRLAGA